MLYQFSLSKQLVHFSSASQTNEWSEEELQLATGGQATTHVRHELKLNSAYAGVPVSAFVSWSLLLETFDI